MSEPLNKAWISSDIDSHPISTVSFAPVHTSYDRWGNALSVSDARNAGWQTTYTYNAANQVLTQAKPDAGGGASVTSIVYDRQGHTYSVTDANGYTQSWIHDSNGNLISEQHADGAQVWNRYDGLGNKTSTWTQTGSSASPEVPTIRKPLSVVMVASMAVVWRVIARVLSTCSRKASPT